MAVLVSLSLCHLLNDTIQSLLPAIYPVLQEKFTLSFTEIGLLHFAFQAVASLFQPAVGLYTDRRPLFHLASIGMGASLAGLVMLAFATSYAVLIVAAMLVGLGSSIFHPDASRNARTASGGRYGFAQSVFQVGDNAGTALGPLLAAFIVLPFGQESIVWFSALALVAMVVLWRVGSWAQERHRTRMMRTGPAPASVLPPRRVAFLLAILALLIFSKFVYIASLTSYYTFYFIETFGVSVATSQLLLFVFLGAGAAGTLVGGPVGDKIGRKTVIWFSILGVLPFTLALPHLLLVATAAFTFVIGFLMSSAFPALVVYGQALLPGRVGMVSGIFFGFAFGVAAVAAAAIGMVADAYGIAFAYQVCAFLPAIGLLTVFLPPEEALREG